MFRAVLLLIIRRYFSVYTSRWWAPSLLGTCRGWLL